MLGTGADQPTSNRIEHCDQLVVDEIPNDNETYSRIGLYEAIETYSRIGLLRSYGNLQSYWTATKLWKLTVVMDYYEPFFLELRFSSYFVWLDP